MKNTITALSIALAGCSSAPVTEVKPVEFSIQNSTALNLANQTFLTQDYWHGKTIKSPLRDFSQEDIEAVQTQLRIKSNSGFHMIMGLIDLANLDLTGAAISVTTAGLAEISNSQHVASHPSWIVAVDAGDFSDGNEAKYYATNLIRKTALDLLHEKGNTLHKVAMSKTKTTFGSDLPEQSIYTINGYEHAFGLYFNGYKYDETPFVKGSTNLIDAEQQYVTVTTSPVFASVSDFTQFTEGRVKGYQGSSGYEEFLMDLTSRLPKGYMLYVPSFPSVYAKTVKSNKAEDWTCITCRGMHGYRLNTFVVPRIYTEGQKYEFITPN